MAPTDQEVIEGLLSILENFYAENISLRGQLRRAHHRGFHDNADRRGVQAANQISRQALRQQFRQAMQSTETWTKFVRENSADLGSVH